MVNAEAEQEIHDLLDGFHRAAAEARFEDYFNRFAAQAYFLGTDAGERWSVAEFREYAHPRFEKGGGWQYRVLERHLQTGPGVDAYWFDEILANQSLGRCRGTGVVVREGGSWKIAHYSLTLLIPNAIADQVGALSIEMDGGLSEILK